MGLILVTNDDGVHAPGLIALFRAMKELGEAFIIAPDRERSAVGHALTLHRPLKVELLRENVYSLNGTPTDCVAVGLGKILPRKPDLIVSGINRGANLGDDVTYSGTVSAAFEGTIMGIPSIAVSLDIHDEPPGAENTVMPATPAHYETAQEFAAQAARFVLANYLPYATLLNVNVPNIHRNEIKGVRFTTQSKRVYDESVHETRSPRGELYYWIGGGKPSWTESEDADIKAVMNGFVSITPVHINLTNFPAMQWLKERWAGPPGKEH
ncbi:MAG: 5'/3'-nucleotidase SurE [Nitrospiraceae bacterium]|nr:5'/3'-nucleotidase SurE [Nitrospiraceae bacterium]